VFYLLVGLVMVVSLFVVLGLFVGFGCFVYWLWLCVCCSGLLGFGLFVSFGLGYFVEVFYLFCILVGVVCLWCVDCCIVCVCLFDCFWLFVYD